jgi:multimeric flavodoxin WrbA
VIDDEMAELLELYLQSDYVGLATPVYSMYMTAMLKSFTDRLLPLATPHIHRADDGTFYHKGRVRRFPRMFFVANSGFPGKHNFDILRAVAAMQSPVLEVYRNCGEILSAEAAAQIPTISAFFDALRDAGKEMVTSGRVSEETVRRIHAELIGEEDYISEANQSFDEEIGKAGVKASE